MAKSAPFPDLAVVILTRDEAVHIRRAIESVADIAATVLVIDSGSTDDTVAIAQSAGATVLHNGWVNYATQMNWGIGKVPQDADWILRLDADEVVTPGLAREIRENLAALDDDIDGVYVGRSMYFMGAQIRHGGLFPIRVLRLFRNGRGHCENRWMDEHIVVEGRTADFSGEIIDDNRKSLGWWTQKHNAYAAREVVDLLNAKYGFMDGETIADLRQGRQSGVKRWIKENVYAKLPPGFRAGAYFFYRYFIRLGILDGKEARSFHVLQGFWYRYLVDLKLHEVTTYMRVQGVDAVTAIADILDIDVRGGNAENPSGQGNRPQ